MSKNIRILVNMIYATEADADARVAAILSGPPPSTRSEPGCLQFEFYRCLSDPRKITVMEIWESKPIYDQHWRLQMANQRGGTPPNASREVEFYERQVYVTVDGVWKPIEEDQRSETVMYV